jgi:hypothetical protein
MIKHMQSSSAITTITTTTTATAASIVRTVPPPHEYLRETLSVRYQECKSCGKRTQLACIKCGYCYTCHWKEEEREKEEKKKRRIQFEQFLPEQNDNNNSSSSTTITMVEARDEISECSDQTKVIIDVFGQKIEPICNYYRCYHKFSLHGCRTHTSCHCKHPVNSIIGVSKNVYARE